MEISDRIKVLRKELNMSRRIFGEKLGVSESVIVNIEYDRLRRKEKKEPLYMLICEKFNVNEDWLRTGEGEMFEQIPEKDEVADIVSDLLEEENPLYDLILETMRTYKKLDYNSQKVICEFTKKLRKNLERKKEG